MAKVWSNLLGGHRIALANILPPDALKNIGQWGTWMFSTNFNECW